MMEFLSYALLGAIVVIIVEAAVWMNACLGLSMKKKEADFTEVMLRAPYRVLWPPKLLVGVAAITLFSAAAKYYRSGGEKLTLGASYFAVLILFGALVFWESLRAITRYDERHN